MFRRIILIAFLLSLVGAEPLPGGENVCNKTIKVVKDKTVDEPVKYELEYEGRCGLLPCTKKRVEIRIDSKVKTYIEEVEVSVCCDGYAETPDRKCAPICLAPCLGQSQKLEVPSARALMRDLEEDSDEAAGGGGYYATNIAINLFLILVCAALVYAVVCYKRSLDRIKAELYYQPTSGSTSSDPYSAPSNYSYGPDMVPGDISSRPRMPLPREPITDNLGKNLNFASATRFLLLDGSQNASKNGQSADINNYKLTPGSKTEAHLMSSQKSSEQNIYYDIQSQAGYSSEKSFNIGCQTSEADSALDSTSIADTNDLSHYQVPKSPTLKQVEPVQEKEDTSTVDNKMTQESDVHDNLYEEIKPRTDPK